MDVWTIVQTALQTIGFPLLWWILRKNGKAGAALAIGQKALDVLSKFLDSGATLDQAKKQAVAWLKVHEGLSLDVAERAVAGAAKTLTGHEEPE